MAGDLVSELLSDPQPEPGKADSLPWTQQYDINLRKLVKFVRETNERDLTHDVNGNSLLDLLDPTRNTIAFVAVLAAHARLAQKTRQSSPALLAHALAFLTTFDPVQARYVGQELRDLLHWLGSYSEASGDVSIIPAIGGAILHVDPSSSTFTSTHLYYVRLCLAAALPRQALPVLDKDIYNFPTDPIKGVDERDLCASHQSSATYITRSSGISADISVYDVQEYYLLGAQVYIGLRHWARAKIFLELVLATPTSQVASPLMVEAYKKLILLNLLSTGSSASSRGLLDQHVFKTVSALSKAYEALADTFKSRDLQKFMAEIDTGTQIWTDEGNLGLVNQVAESLRRYRVIDLQKTYSALPVDQIAVHLSLPSNTTIDLLRSMIRDGHIKANLSQSPGHDTAANSPSVLRFLSHGPTHASVGLDQAAILQAKYQQIGRLSTHVKEADRKLAIAKDYVEFVRKSKRAEGAGAPGYEDTMEDGWNSPAVEADEDIMAA